MSRGKWAIVLAAAAAAYSAGKTSAPEVVRAERLEQLRALEHGYRIRVVEITHPSPGVDTPEELERLRRRPPSEG